ncbi:hypothetical protein C7441_108117 [Pseudaminobacter salicylatoxidans]|uniref:Uncharacterized protein n=1 Tax=Pseudaminobacter salicylatoxidans TaxID=93369 RepID=A0A316CNJ7_PSESE|nr:hypothetical protein C7441_108117 [Pseudaminobacter salicylatoxidans]
MAVDLPDFKGKIDGHGAEKAPHGPRTGQADQGFSFAFGGPDRKSGRYFHTACP